MSKTLNDSMSEFIKFMQKYNDADEFFKLPTQQSINDIQSDIVDELGEEIETANLITWEHDSDGDRPNYDNLLEWLKQYYILEKK